MIRFGLWSWSLRLLVQRVVWPHSVPDDSKAPAIVFARFVASSSVSVSNTFDAVLLLKQIVWTVFTLFVHQICCANAVIAVYLCVVYDCVANLKSVCLKEPVVLWSNCFLTHDLLNWCSTDWKLDKNVKTKHSRNGSNLSWWYLFESVRCQPRWTT